MKKRPPAPKVKDQICRTAYYATPRVQRRSGKNICADPVQSELRLMPNHIPGVSPREEPAEMPRLFIRGLGGSIKLDLLGLGIRLSGSAFAHQVSDESLSDLHIHRGDIAVIDSVQHILNAGNLILVELDGRGVLRRLTKKKRLWYLETVDGNQAESIPLVMHPLQGTVVGILRLFKQVKPVKYRGTNANFEGHSEWSRPDASLRKNLRRGSDKTDHPKLRYPTRSGTSVVLASEKPSPYRLSEIPTKKPYSV